jgi:hypothetical protein
MIGVLILLLGCVSLVACGGGGGEGWNANPRVQRRGNSHVWWRDAAAVERRAHLG